MPAIPSVSQDRPAGIPAIFQKSCNIISMIWNALAVLSSARRKHIDTDPLAVDLKLIQPQRRGIEPRSRNRPLHRELLVQIRRRWNRIGPPRDRRADPFPPLITPMQKPH